MKGFTILQTKFINRTNAVESYMVEISKYKILPENKLREYIFDYKTTGDANSRRKIFESCAKFVITCAKKYQNQGIEFMDLIIAGNHGVLAALEHFELENQKCKFVSYAMYYIRLYIQEAFSECVESIKMPIKVKRDVDNYSEKSTFRTIGKLTIQPDTFSLNEPLRFHKSSWEDGCPASENLMVSECWESYSSIFKNMDIDCYLKILDKTERDIIVHVFGLYKCKTKTIDQVASMLGLKKQKVILLRDKAIKKMNKMSQNI